MLSVRVPIYRRIVDPDPAGPIRTQLQARLSSYLLARADVWVQAPISVIDTGSNYTMVSAEWARQTNIPIPDTTSRLPMRMAAGTREMTVRDGQISIRFPFFPDRVFRLYCVFSEDYSPAAPLLFGLNNFIDVFRVTFDGRYSHDAPAGHVLLETD